MNTSGGDAAGGASPPHAHTAIYQPATIQANPWDNAPPRAPLPPPPSTFSAKAPSSPSSRPQTLRSGIPRDDRHTSSPGWSKPTHTRVLTPHACMPCHRLNVLAWAQHSTASLLRFPSGSVTASAVGIKIQSSFLVRQQPLAGDAMSNEMGRERERKREGERVRERIFVCMRGWDAV